MSVVKKYKKGGPVSNSYEDYEAFIAKKLNETNFTAKGLQGARKTASKFNKLVKSGKLDEAYSYDSLAGEYSINTEVLDDDLANQE